MKILSSKGQGSWVKKKGSFLFFLTLATCYLTLMAHALGQAGTDIAILNAGVGARALGMGSAFTAISDNADAPYWNPAGLALITSCEITTMQTKLSTDADHYYLSYVNPLWGGTLGISWIQVGTGNLTQTSSEVDSHNEVQNLNSFSYFSNAYLLSYGKKINDHISFGLTGKYLSSDMQVTGGQGYGYSLTPGFLLILAPWDLTLGFKVDELFNEQKWGTGAVEKVPAKLRVGIAYGMQSRGKLALDLAQTIRSGYDTALSAGYEWTNEALALRLGYNNGITAGAGFISGMVQLDYAYVTQDALSRSNVHRVSLGGVW